MTIHRLDVTDSTNTAARAGRPGDVFTAERQLSGRGRLDHAWHSAPGANLTFSIVLSAAGRPPQEVATLPLVVGFATLKALAALLPPAAGPALKWPNDVLAGGRKLAGILCERHGDNVIAGVGVNVNETDFPQAIAARATSLAALAGRPFDRDDVLRRLLASIESWHKRWLDAGFSSLHAEFAPFDWLKGRVVSVWQTDSDPAPIKGVCGGIAADGTLDIAGTRVYAGEAHVEADA